MKELEGQQSQIQLGQLPVGPLRGILVGSDYKKSIVVYPKSRIEVKVLVLS